jgi:hypothetical protein
MHAAVPYGMIGSCSRCAGAEPTASTTNQEIAAME